MIDCSNLPFKSLMNAYPLWLKCAYNYYYEELFDVGMSDDLWTGIGFAYVKHLDKIPYLFKIGFTGNTLGVNVDKDELLREIERVS